MVYYFMNEKNMKKYVIFCNQKIRNAQTQSKHKAKNKKQKK